MNLYPGRHRTVDPDSVRQRFAANLREHRTRAGFTQEALGRRCGLNRIEVGLIERAQREPRLTTIVKLANGLGISPADLLEGIGR